MLSNWLLVISKDFLKGIVISLALLCSFSTTLFSQKTPIKTFKDSFGTITEVALSENNEYLAIGNELGIVSLRDFNTGKEIFKSRHHKEKVEFIFFYPAKNELVTTDKNEIIFSSLETGEIISKISIFENIEWVELSIPDAQIYILASFRGEEDSWLLYKEDLESKRYQKFLNDGRISQFRISPSGQKLFTTKSRSLLFVDSRLGVKQQQFDQHNYKIKSIDINPNEPEWMITNDNHLLRIWSTENGRSLHLPWPCDQAFLIHDSEILTSNKDSVVMRDYKSTLKKEVIKMAPGNIKEVFVSHHRDLCLIVLGNNTVEAYETGAVFTKSTIASSGVKKELPKDHNVSTNINSDDENIYSLYKTEIDNEIALKGSLFKPRGEFEKSSDYEIRKAEAESYKNGIFKYYKDKHLREQELEKSLALAKKRYLDSLAKRDEERQKTLFKEKIRDSYKEFTTVITTLGTYDADAEVFPITIDGQTNNVKVPIANARDFKDNYTAAKVVGTSQLLEDAETMDKFNIKIFDMKTGAIYNFGNQKEPLYMNGKKENSLLNELVLNFNNNRIQTVSNNESRGSQGDNKPNESDNLENQITTYLKKKKYYALLIGVENYLDPQINSLDNPVNDALRLKGVLQNDYTFEEENIILLKNPTRTEIIESFDDLAKKINNDDNLLIFYAGHGIWDEKLKQGYWLPRDSKKDSKAAWLSNGTIRDYVGGIKTKHTLLIADACFSGGIFKTRDVFMSSRAILELYKLPSRKAMTSGNMKTVPDKSVFMEYLIKRLKDNTNKVLTAEQLFGSLRTAVINNSNGQVPQYGDIREAGDEGGDFVLLKRED